MGVNTVKTLLIAILFLAASAQAQQVPAYDPPAGSPVCYVSAFGNDANSGAWWDSAKASIMACFDVLPQGAYAGGTIYLQDKNGVSIPACPAGSPPGCGIWIMGPGDPNYASPPAGWRKKLGATPIYILGVGAASTAGSNKPQVSVTGGSNADAMHPSLWLSGATPVVVDIPASAGIPANEIAEMALHLQGYRADATPGQVSVMSGEQFKADSIQVGPGIAPVITSGYGVPTVACVAPSGCLYLRLDGSAGATLYVFEGTAWTAK